MSHLPHTLGNPLKLGALALLFLAASAHGAITVGPWTPLFQGIDSAVGSAQVDANDPFQQAVNALRIDLQNPTISFYTTPQSGPLETTTQTTRDFLQQNNLAVAVNANFWDIQVNAYQQEQVNLHGLAVSNGAVVSPAESGFQALTLTADNHAAIVSNGSVSLPGITTAVSGNALILSAGVDLADPTDTTPQPRTAAGISQDGRYLILLTIDGRDPGHSDGATDFQTAQWMLRFGAYDAINLDGGGSTTMVRNDGNGNGILMNIPSGNEAAPTPGLERFDGNNLGVFAQPLPEPATLAVGIIALATLLHRRPAKFRNRRQ